MRDEGKEDSTRGRIRVNSCDIPNDSCATDPDPCSFDDYLRTFMMLECENYCFLCASNIFPEKLIDTHDKESRDDSSGVQGVNNRDSNGSS